MRAGILAIALLIGGSANAATFHVFYDDSVDQILGTDALIGSGTFSYDGAPAAGAFALSSLNGLAFSATVSGQSFTTSDLTTALSTSGIVVYSLGGGEFGMVFTGSGGQVGGSFDLRNQQTSYLLSHEPTAGISNPIGCCVGDGTVNAFQLSNSSSLSKTVGDYAAATMVIPEPSTLTLWVIGLLGLGVSRRRFRV